MENKYEMKTFFQFMLERICWYNASQESSDHMKDEINLQKWQGVDDGQVIIDDLVFYYNNTQYK